MPWSEFQHTLARRLGLRRRYNLFAKVVVLNARIRPVSSLRWSMVTVRRIKLLDLARAGGQSDRSTALKRLRRPGECLSPASSRAGEQFVAYLRRGFSSQLGVRFRPRPAPRSVLWWARRRCECGFGVGLLAFAFAKARTPRFLPSGSALAACWLLIR